MGCGVHGVMGVIQRGSKNPSCSNNLSVIGDNRPQHKNSVTEEVENLSVIRDNRPQHKDSVTGEVENCP